MIHGEGLAVRPFRHHGIKRIDYSEYSGLERELLPPETIRITLPVIPFMVLENDLPYPLKRIDGSEDLLAYEGVGFNQVVFLFGELPCFCTMKPSMPILLMSWRMAACPRTSIS
jgi:hypothetical protein